MQKQQNQDQNQKMEDKKTIQPNGFEKSKATFFRSRTRFANFNQLGQVPGQPLLKGLHSSFSDLKNFTFLTFNTRANNLFCTARSFNKDISLIPTSATVTASLVKAEMASMLDLKSEEQNKKSRMFTIQNVGNPGKYHMPFSKRNMKHKVSDILTLFFKELAKKKIKLTNDVTLGIQLSAPTKIKSAIVTFLTSYLHLENQSHFFQIDGKKAFNGCRGRKMVSKKRHIVRVFK